MRGHISGYEPSGDVATRVSSARRPTVRRLSLRRERGPNPRVSLIHSTQDRNGIRVPKLIVQTTPSAGDRGQVTLSEQVAAASLQSPHYARQLIERVAWATADAEAIESSTRDWRDDHGSTPAPSVRRRTSSGDRRPSNAARRALLGSSALVVVIATVLPLASAALADSARHGHEFRGRLGRGAADGLRSSGTT